jgi:hypothetical protein
MRGFREGDMQSPSSSPSGPIPIYQPAASPAPRCGVRTIGICVPDPEGIEDLCETLAHVEGGEVMVVQDTAAALQAAFQGKLDALVILPSVMTADALTALSFLQDEHPEVTLYAVEATQGTPAFRLCPLANFLAMDGPGL